MKNLKKVLALALVFAMTLTLFAGAAFNDQASIGADYTDDVNMLVELGVLNGYEDNTFRPENNVTRAEFAKMAYTLKYGADDKGLLFSGSKSAFTDVEGVSSIAWAKGYINYCANQKIIAGVGNGKFNPGGNVTVAEAAKMLLVILGCNPQTEGFVGLNWQGNVVAKAIELGVFNGWSGDPTQPATRQLVAKLMRNTVFAPIYVYSPVTGAGSQMQVLKPDQENAMLGQVTMKLEHVTGLVVANENNFIETDAEGQAFDTPVTSATNDESTLIKYEAENEMGVMTEYELTIPDVSLSDDLLGCYVEVYYRHETESKNSEIILLGNVLKSSKSVVYDVDAADIKFFPNKDYKKSGSVRPYISATTADGEEIVINTAVKTDRIKNGTDYKGADFFPADKAEVSFYSLDSDNTNYEAGMTLVDKEANAVVTNMGKPLPIKYRLVSLDGGKTISYVFASAKYGYGKVNYNEAKGTITGSGVIDGTGEVGEDVEIYEGLKKGDRVVATYENGKAVLHPTETVTGAVESYDGNTAVINGETYVGSANLVGSDTLAKWFKGDGNKYLRGATYVTYGNLLLEVDEDAEVEISLDGYAVVLESSMDPYTDAPKVRLGLADGSEETYFVSFLKDGTSEIDIEENEEGFRTYVANNAMTGTVVSYAVRSGNVELTIETDVIEGTAASIADSTLTVDGKKYFAEDGSVMFLLYNQSANTKKISFKTYKLDSLDMESPLKSGALVAKDDTDSVNGQTFDFAKVLTTKKTSNDVMLAVMTAGRSVPNPTYAGDNIGLIVESIRRYDATNRKHYLDLAIVSMDDKAIVAGKYTDVSAAKLVGDAGDNQEGAATYAEGVIVNFVYDGTEFTTVSPRDNGSNAAQTATYAGVDGFYKVTITEANDKRISFYNYGAKKAAGTPADQMLPLHKYIDLKVVALLDGEVVGEEIEELYKMDNINATDFNAIIEVMDGQIIKVFSIQGNVEGYKA